MSVKAKVIFTSTQQHTVPPSLTTLGWTNWFSNLSDPQFPRNRPAIVLLWRSSEILISKGHKAL